jgi:hypothetical protein
MSAEEHKTPSSVNNFCANRAPRCGCGNKYIKNAKDKAPAWASFSFKKRVHFDKTGDRRPTTSSAPPASVRG